MGSDGVSARCEYSGRRGCGRSARHLAHLLDLAEAGKKIVYLSHCLDAAKYHMQLALGLAAAGGAKPNWARNTRILFLGGGAIAFHALPEIPDRALTGLKGAHLAMDHAADFEGDWRQLNRWREVARCAGVSVVR